MQKIIMNKTKETVPEPKINNKYNIKQMLSSVFGYFISKPNIFEVPVSFWSFDLIQFSLFLL